MCGAYRLHLGGAGALAGVLVIVEAATLGTALGYLRSRDEVWVSPARLWAFGMLVHVLMLALQLLIPGVGWDVLYRIGPTVLVFYPLAFLLAAQVFLDGERSEEAQRALLESEERYRAVVEDTPVLLCRFLPGGEITHVNEAYCKFFERTSEELVGSSFLELIPEGDRETVMGNISAIMAESPTQSHEHRVVAAGSEIRWTRWTNRALFDSQGKAIAYQSIGEDITARKRAEAQAARFSRVLEGSLNEILIFDSETLHFVEVNRGARENLGYTMEEFRHLTPLDLKPEVIPERLVELLEPLRTGEQEKVEFTTVHRRKDGTRYPVEVHVELMTDDPPLFVAIVLDITDRRRAEEERERLEDQLRQAHKMEAIGTLAGGIAHDFNNILYAILGYTEIAIEEVDGDSSLYEMLREIQNAAERAAELVRQILVISRKRSKEYEPVQVQAAVEEAMRILRGTLPSTIEIDQRIDEDCGTVMADVTEMHQIVLNLCTNAYHAMRDQGGTLTIELKRVRRDEDEREKHPDLQPVEYARLVVADTGCGMEPETMSRIFEPYFTTKDTGEGTGLGLATVHGIVHDYGGVITVDSQPGRGTSFAILLPLVSHPEALGEEQEVEVVARGRGERLLVLDDEESLARLHRMALERVGYRVRGFTVAEEALDAFRSDPNGFDLVVTDQTMPRMTGVEFSKQLLQLRPDLPIILCTGHSDVVDRETAMGMGIRAYLEKPTVARELAKTVRRLLDESQGDAENDGPE